MNINISDLTSDKRGKYNMQITKEDVTVRDVANGYEDKGDNGVYALQGKLILKPKFQRNFVYNQQQQAAVIDSIRQGYPLGLIYWAKRPDGKLEVLDGQQRLRSICSFVHDDYSIDHRFWHNLTQDEKNVILDYKLDVRVCDGTEAEKLAYFKRINTPGVTLNNQELLNATYSGDWLEDAKQHFSKRKNSATDIADGYISGNPIRQDILEQVLSWAANKEKLEAEADYMAEHQKDVDANSLWQYYQKVIGWAKILFPTARKGVTDHQPWGILYNKYKDKTYNTNDLEKTMEQLLLNDDVKKKSGIIPFLLSDRTDIDYKYLNLRQFTKSQKIRQYEKQKGICPICHKHFALDEMEADHIIPFSLGKPGWSNDNNLQLLCKHDNRAKSAKVGKFH